MTLDTKEQLALQFNPQQEAITAEISSLKKNYRQIAVNALQDTYISEAEGTSGTEKLGKGPVYKEKREKHDVE